ncbi:MAG: sulfur carrier protein ThiS [Candidatus Berkiella sp.]
MLDSQVLPKVFAIAVNGKFVAREDYRQHILQSDDQVAILTPMQGG